MKYISKAIFIALITIGLLGAKNTPYKEEDVSDDQYHKQLTYFALNYKQWDLPKGCTAIIGEQEQEELEVYRLIVGSKTSKPVFKATTHIGYFGLFYLMQPIDNKEVLLKRQSFIKTIVEDEQLYERLGDLLKTCAKYEHEFLSYWNRHESVTQKAECLYFSQPKTFFWLFDLPQFTKVLNSSSVCLEGSIVKELGRKIGILCGIFGLKSLMEDAAKSFEEKRDISLLKSLKSGVSNFMYDHNPFEYHPRIDAVLASLNEKDPFAQPNVFSTAATFGFAQSLCINERVAIPLALGDRINGFNSVFTRCNLSFLSPLSFFLAGSTQLFYDYIGYLFVHDQVEGFSKVHKAMQDLHKRTVAVAHYFKAVQKIEKLLQQDARPEIATFVKDCLYDTKKISKKMNRLMSLLQTDTFTKAGSLIYLRGNVLLAHKLLQEIHGELTERLRNLALVDAHVAVATFVKQARQKGLPICFVDYIDVNQSIELTMQDGWLPLLTRENYVYNSVSLGGATARNLILTGPNGCGKSTVLKLLGVGALFGHTSGVVPATSATMSVFSSIKTSLQADHKDNMSDGLSTYMVADRAGERMRNHALESTQDKKTLLLYGEPYRGTPDGESARKIMDFAHTVAPNEHFLMALETHIFAPTKLEVELPGVFANGHMAIDEAADGSFVRLFKLQDGPALWWFENHAKRGRFVDWITVLRKQEEAAQEEYVNQLIGEFKRLLAQEEQAQKNMQKPVGKVKAMLNKLHSYVQSTIIA